MVVLDNGVAIVTAALLGITGSLLVNAVSVNSKFRELKNEFEKIRTEFGDVSARGNMTVQNDRISGEIKISNEKIDVGFGKVDRSFEKLDDGVTNLLINDAAKIEKLSGLAENKRLMLENVEALVIDYTKMQAQILELRRENNELLSRNEQLSEEISALKSEIEMHFGYEMEL